MDVQGHISRSTRQLLQEQHHNLVNIISMSAQL
jgi:hypothetical protein